jgi:hypothetical protein
MKIIEQSVVESNAYSLFVYAIRSQVTRDYYLRRLRIFFNHINLEPDKTIEERCNYFADKATTDPSWVFNCIVRFSLMSLRKSIIRIIASVDKRMKMPTSIVSSVLLFIYYSYY